MKKNEFNNKQIYFNKKIRKYGTGGNDRIFAKFLYELFGDKIDGWYSKQIFSPFYPGVLQSEILLFNYNKIERDINNKYDWNSWKKYLPFKIPDIKYFNFNIELLKKNGNFRLIKFYLNNYNKYKNYNFDIFKNKNIKILTFNVHYLSSINLNDDDNKCFNKLILLINKIDFDVIGLQQFPNNYIDKLIKNIKYKNVIYTENGSFKNSNKKLFCILLSKHKINKYKIDKYIIRNKYQNIIKANININNNNINVIIIHLPIGKRYNNLEDLKDVNKNYMYNYNIRKNILYKILNYKNTLILGDFNFTPIDLESKLIIKTTFNKSFNKLIKDIKYTTPFKTIVDYILINNNFNNLKYNVIDFPYSDHLPIVLQLEA